MDSYKKQTKNTEIQTTGIQEYLGIQTDDCPPGHQVKPSLCAPRDREPGSRRQGGVDRKAALTPAGIRVEPKPPPPAPTRE